MFAYCSNNPIMGYDPTGEINWKGFWTGVAIAAIGVALVAATVVTAGAAAGVAAVVVGTIGLALAATGTVTAYGAATEKPVVFDATVSDGFTHDKQGYSIVVDFDSDSVGVDTYYHYGKTTGGYSCAYGAGVVGNYNEPGDYGGPFADVASSVTYKGADLGIDVCTDPTKVPFTGCWAALLTFGTSFPPNQTYKPSFSGSVDYYVPLSYVEWDT